MTIVEWNILVNIPNIPFGWFTMGCSHLVIYILGTVTFTKVVSYIYVCLIFQKRSSRYPLVEKPVPDCS